MKVLFVVTEKPESGIRIYAESVAKELRKKVSVSIDENFLGRYDVIHIHSCKPENILRVKLLHPLTPLVATTHMTAGEAKGLVPGFLLGLVNPWLMFSYGLCNRVFAISQFIYDDFAKNAALGNRLLFLPNPVDLKKLKNPGKKAVSEFRKRFKIPKAKKLVLCVGSVQYRKGVFDFADAAKRLPQYEFVWVGKIPDNTFLAKRKELTRMVESPPTPNIRFTGPLFGKQLAAAFHSADLFWLPSYSETFGLVIVEAASCGKLVLIRKLPVTAMFREFAVTFESDPEKKIVEMLESPQKFAHLKQKSAKVVKKFGMAHHIRTLIREYEKVSGKKA